MNQDDRWFGGIAPYLIRQAARKAPPALSERLGEEWLADLCARPGTLSRLRIALGCCWATNVIAHEFGAPVRAAAAAAGNKTTIDDQAGSVPSFSRRTMVVLLIVGLHVVVIGVLATAIDVPKIFKASPQGIDVRFLPRPAPPAPPKPADPTLTRISVDPLPPPVGPPTRTEQTTTIEDQVTEAPSARPAGPPSMPVHRVLGGPGVGFPNTDDFYPQASIRAHERGIAIVGVCVDGAGRLTGKPAIDQSSGSARLDEAALRLAKAGSGHYRATTDDGRPVTACYPFRVRFQLRD